VTFNVLASGPTRPQWHRQPVMVEKPVLSGAYAYTVQTAWGNYRIKVRVQTATRADLLTLSLAQGVTKRALTDLFGTGDDYTNVMLLAVSNEDAYLFEDLAEADLEFAREA
jgi:hypothetical protein